MTQDRYMIGYVYFLTTPEDIVLQQCIRLCVYDEL